MSDTNLIDPAALVIVPRLPASVTRLPDGRFQLSWQDSANSATVFAGQAPDRIDTDEPVAQVKNRQAVTVSYNGSLRPFFLLQLADDRSYLVAERTLPLAGGVNFRDLGGLPTEDGRVTRWGRLYRSGMLTHLTEADLSLLSQLDIQLVCDLRSASETADRPNRLPLPAPEQLHLPVTSPDSRLFTAFQYRHRLEELMLAAYTKVTVDQNLAVIHTLFTKLADDAQLPLVIHCTAGKDRTGVAVALLLMLLGVPDEVIVAEYTLSNLHHDRFVSHLRRDVARLLRVGFSSEQLQPVFVAPPARMRALLAYVRRRYGGIEPYLQDAVGVTAVALAQIRHNFLTRP